MSALEQSSIRLTFAEPLNSTMKILLLIFTALFLPWMISESFRGFALQYLALNPQNFLAKGCIWQVVTSIFLHGSMTHFISNMVFFCLFGSAIANAWRKGEFLFYFFLCGIGSSLAAYAYDIISGAALVPSLGASGAIFGLMAAYAVIYGERVILFMFVLPMKAKYMVLILFILEVLLIISAAQDGIGHVAHVMGAVIGWGYLKYIRTQQNRLAVRGGNFTKKKAASSRIAGLEIMDDIE